VQDRMHSGLRDEDLHPDVLRFYARALKGSDVYLEFIALNQATSDETVAEIAASASEKIVELISQNQLRILREDRIIRAIIGNPLARPSTKDSVLDFCVRSGVMLPDLPEYVEARRRVLGEEPAIAEKIVEAEANTVEKVISEFGDAVIADDARVDDTQRMNMTQRVMKMSVSQKIKLASLGNKEARTLLLRDSNKLVALAAVQSPRITDGEIVMLSNSRTLNDEVMRVIVNNREWLKNYQVKCNLVNNPKCPLSVSLKLLQHLHPAEMKVVARNKNIPSTLQTQARNALAKKESPGGGGGGH
jgi:hypothetical protein